MKKFVSVTGQTGTPTFPVDLTPFHMQKKQMTQTMSKHKARSHFTGPRSCMPVLMARTLFLQRKSKPVRSGKDSPGQNRFPLVELDCFIFGYNIRGVISSNQEVILQFLPRLNS